MASGVKTCLTYEGIKLLLCLVQLDDWPRLLYGNWKKLEVFCRQVTCDFEHSQCQSVTEQNKGIYKWTVIITEVTWVLK